MDQITLAIIEARKQDVFDVIDNQANKSLESLSEKNDEVEKQVKFIESANVQTEFQLIRSLTTEILGFCETIDTTLQEQIARGNHDTEYIPRFNFRKSKLRINVLNSEGIRNVHTGFSENEV